MTYDLWRIFTYTLSSFQVWFVIQISDALVFSFQREIGLGKRMGLFASFYTRVRSGMENFLELTNTGCNGIIGKEWSEVKWNEVMHVFKNEVKVKVKVKWNELPSYYLSLHF